MVTEAWSRGEKLLREKASYGGSAALKHACSAGGSFGVRWIGASSKKQLQSL